MQGIYMVVIVLGALIPLLALIDILTGKFKGNDKLIWLLVVLFLNLLGVVLYVLLGRKKRL